MTASTWDEVVRARWLSSERPAIVTETDEWSGDELLRRAGGASSWLDEIGVPRGAAVPALVDESPAALALAVGSAFSGRPMAPLGTKLPPADLAAVVRGLEANILVTDRSRRELADEVATQAGVRVFVLDDMPARGPLPTTPIGADDVAAVIHTSGTTGLPKPVYLRQQPLAARVRIYSAAIEMGVGDRYSSASPLYHVAGLGMALVALAVGATVIPYSWFSVAGWRDLTRLEPSHALLVPTMIDVLLAEGLLDAGHLRVLQYGSAPIHPGTLTDAFAALPDTRLIQIFGQTEVSPVTALGHEDHVRAVNGCSELLASVGRAIPGVELRVENPDDAGVGELIVRAPHLFVSDDDGWRRTGDVGTIDVDGYVMLKGRRNDRIVRGGENIYPLEIEMVLGEHPDVSEVAVVGMPDRRWGEVVRAVVVPRDPENPPPIATLQAFARERLARFKVPAAIDFAVELPRTPSGKVLRRALTP